MKEVISMEDKHYEEQPDNEMVDDYSDVVELGKEMEQISEENDEDKLNKEHDEDVRSDLDE